LADLPQDVRWTPRQHYDAACSQLEAGAWQKALVHVLLGILQVEMARNEMGA
jgi:hypothetical protein